MRMNGSTAIQNRKYAKTASETDKIKLPNVEFEAIGIEKRQKQARTAYQIARGVEENDHANSRSVTVVHGPQRSPFWFYDAIGFRAARFCCC